MKEWLRFPLPRSAMNRAPAARLVLRAHAARKSNSQFGLFFLFRRNVREGPFLIWVRSVT
jgi:hypothetical protein